MHSPNPYRSLRTRALSSLQRISTTAPTNDTTSSSLASVAVYVENACVAYPSSVSRDKSWNAAYGLQIASWTLSGLVWTVLLYLLLFVRARRRSGGMLVVCGCGVMLGGVLLQGLVFVFYQSDLCTDSPIAGIQLLQHMGVMKTECQMGSAAILLIVAMALYFVAGIAACWAGRSFGPPMPQRRVIYPRSDRDDSEDEDRGDNTIDGV
jgi:hypothetical protein